MTNQNNISENQMIKNIQTEYFIILKKQNPAKQAGFIIND